jgi:hypothetical protein
MVGVKATRNWELTRGKKIARQKGKKQCSGFLMRSWHEQDLFFSLLSTMLASAKKLSWNRFFNVSNT